MLTPDPVNGFIKRHYDQCRRSFCNTPSMIPEIFAGGESRQVVSDLLAKAGYSPYAEGFIKANADIAFPACDINYYVMVEFDENDRLLDASGQTASVCM